MSTDSLKSVVISPDGELWQLNREIDQLEAESSRLEAERTAVAKQAIRAKRRYCYLCFLRWLRSPATTYELWPIGVMLTGSFVFGATGFVLIHLVTNSFPLAAFGFIWGVVIGICLFAIFLYYPADTFLPPAIFEAETESLLQQSRLTEVTPRVSLVKQRLQSLLQERRQWIVSGKLLRASLLQLNWKQMRGYVWEDYLVQVCRALGAKVERTGKSGDQGTDLIVEFGTRRIAVQAKGFNDEYGVNNKAVQEAYTGKACYKCDACAVITNTRFMNSAKQSAIATGCILIGEDEFPDFVMGKIEL